MPSRSIAQRRLFAIAENNPGALHAGNRGLANLPKQTLHDFASTPEKGLPDHMADGGGNWASGAFSGNQGGLHRALGVPAGKKIPAGKLQQGLHSSSPHVQHMAQADANIQGIRKRRTFGYSPI